MRYDSHVVEQARNTDMITFFSQYRGFSFNLKGSEYRCKEHPSLSVKADRLTWFWHSRGVGGRGTLDYLMKIEGMAFRDAMAALTGAEPSAPEPHTTPPLARARLILPEKADFLYKRLYAYLNHTRGIDASIITALVHERKIYEDQRGNVVFVGYDENNVARFASLRGTHTDKPFRMDCAGSDKRYSFNMMARMPSERLYVFESPIDAMSHASIETIITGGKGSWNCHSRLSLAGTSDAALSFLLRRYSSIKELIFCLDNDTAGQEASANMARVYGEMGYITRIEPPQGKDYNEDLLNLKKEGLIIDERKQHHDRDCR